SADRGRMSRSVVTSLLSILKIRHTETREKVYRRFSEELRGIAGTDFSVLVVSQEGSGYRVLTACPDLPDNIAQVEFQPGEGPIGKAIASGEVIELAGRSRIERAWNDLEPVNQDFLNRLFEEQGLPQFELTIPLRVMERVVAAITVFSHADEIGDMARIKGLLLLATHLLSIKLTMAELSPLPGRSGLTTGAADAGHLLNRVNNDLATIVGRAQLLQQQPDTTGRAKYSADEIIKAAEQAADVIRSLQSDVASPADIVDQPTADVNEYLDSFLQRRHVTGNLYMFDDNRAVMLQKDLVRPCPYSSAQEDIRPFVEHVLRYFVSLVEEGEEVLIKSEVRDSRFYISLVRGTSDSHRRFDSAARDFGDPDVLPRDIVSENLLPALTDNGGEVSFDCFGRRPTYLSFRFPCDEARIRESEGSKETAIAGLKILAIDDQQMILDLLTGIGQSLGIELTAVRNPSEGINLFRTRPFDMVMVDLAIGSVSGWDVAREIKAHSPATPIIMLTGWGADVAGEKAAEGIVDYTLSKPFRIEQLTEIISRAGSRQISS
ncbi:MAG: response regulator, partial [Candidatus Thorarchaeota archaeon]